MKLVQPLTEDLTASFLRIRDSFDQSGIWTRRESNRSGDTGALKSSSASTDSERRPVEKNLLLLQYYVDRGASVWVRFRSSLVW